MTILFFAGSVLAITRPTSASSLLIKLGIQEATRAPSVPLGDVLGVADAYESSGKGDFPEGVRVPAGFFTMRVNGVELQTMTPCGIHHYLATLDDGILQITSGPDEPTSCTAEERVVHEWLTAMVAQRPEVALTTDRLVLTIRKKSKLEQLQSLDLVTVTTRSAPFNDSASP